MHACVSPEPASFLCWLCRSVFSCKAPAGKAALADLGKIASVVSCADLLSFDLTGAVGAKAQIKSATLIEKP
jgi:hypothetical protein